MTLLLFIVTLSLLILIHEWGHFFAARRFGIGIEEFGFGFPPAIAHTVKNGTRFVLNLLPIGGYVKIKGESGEGADAKDSFASRPIWQRVIIVGAGVFMNMALAWALLSVAHGIGIPQALPDGAPVSGAAVSIIAVEPDSPAAKAGILFGDTVTAIIPSNQPPIRITTIDDVQRITQEHAGEAIDITLTRGRSERIVRAVPRQHPPEGSGALGIALEYTSIQKTVWYKAPLEGARSTYIATAATLSGFADAVRSLVEHGKAPAGLAGPVGLYTFTGEVKDLGLAAVLQFIAIISINLAILNALPIPALDGGRILFMIIEKIRRKAISPQIENATHTIGFAVLIILMIIVTFHDVRNLF